MWQRRYCETYQNAEKGADDGKVVGIEERMRLIEAFIEGRNLLKSQPEEAIQKIREVIRDRNSRDYLR